MIREVNSDIWDFHKNSHYIVIPTNGSFRGDGLAIMGKGLALEAKIRFPQLPIRLGDKLQDEGNQVYVFWGLGIITFPTKHKVSDLYSSPNLIEKSCKELIEVSKNILIYNKNMSKDLPELPEEVCIPRVGCGSGGLSWETVKPIVYDILGEKTEFKFLVVGKC